MARYIPEDLPAGAGQQSHAHPQLAEAIYVEKQLIGTVLDDPGRAAYALDRLCADHFASLQARAVFIAIQSCRARSEAMDIIDVAHELTRNPPNLTIDGSWTGELAMLATKRRSSPEMAEVDALYILEYARDRRIQQLGLEIQKGEFGTDGAIVELGRIDLEFATAEPVRARAGLDHLERATLVYHDGRGLLQAGTLTLMYGQAGSGKSMVALDVAVRAALAGKRVLFVAFEGADFTIDRLHDRRQVMGPDARAAFERNFHSIFAEREAEASRLHFHQRLTADGMTGARLGKMLRMADDELPEIIIIDSFVSCWGHKMQDGAANDQNMVTAALAALRALPSTTGCAVLLLAHESRKQTGNGPLGSTAFMTLPDNVVKVTGEPGDGDWTMVDDKRRGGRKRTWTLALDPDLQDGAPDEYRVEIELVDKVAAAAIRAERQRAEVLALVDGTRGKTQVVAELKLRKSKLRREDAFEILKALIDEGEVIENGRGKPLSQSSQN